MPGKRPCRRMVIVSRTAALARARMQPAAFSPTRSPLTLVLAPTGMAQPVVERLFRKTPAALTAPAMRVRLAAMGRRPGDAPAAVLLPHMAAEVAHRAAIVPASGATLD